MKKDYFAVGKLKHDILTKLLNNFVSDLEIKDKRVILGSRIGEDAAVIDMGDKFLVAKTDPITFATDEIGYYAVNVNVNDVVCSGAIPKWFQATILLPEVDTTDKLINDIFKSIHDTCKSMDITVIGGHTEVTADLNRPIVIGSLIGEVEKENLVKTSGAKPGDSLILTKGIFIEGTSIIGREKEQDLKEKGFNLDFIEKCKNYLYNPGISVRKEALLANQIFEINSMHDPTEGGLATAIAEMTIASNTGVMIEKQKIKVLDEPLKLSNAYQLNPLNTISSGSLLISLKEEHAEDLINLLRKNEINADIIGNIVPKEQGLRIKETDGKLKTFSYSETDEITKIF
jgi:hydrogenase maturation factor